ncbi:glycoside hydrolase family 5 protein [Phyllobacterium leguminum]|uniref:Aryl-phospho-beta-D-glucosidase BglC (GH1 family) n=1 Tax=Phyllobacterium leguminum TaxID=314237 RepID=A0A318T3P1_9HYPH|nr:cellulase family glycosylhydrolase [Phyllobacterium leguminum]PYE88691.1 aryl-phospho-beta-D-glucosidase BglC (GH1 family) [Phyllobacterium leguminum]
MTLLAAMFKLKKPLFPALALAVAFAMPAAAATFKMKRGVNLDIWTTWPDESRWNDESVLLPYPEWRKSLEPQDLAALKQAGFDFVRIPVDPAPFLSDKTIIFRDKLYESVLQSAHLVNEAGLNAVVDLHLFPTERSVSMTNVMADPALFERYLDVVRTMGRTLSREAPDKIAFELMNEPVVDCDATSSPRWPGMLRQLFAAARASATNLTLVLSGGCWGKAEALARVDPRDIPDDNIIWSFHTYGPFLLTHQGALWAGDFIRYVTGLPYPPYSVPPAERERTLEEIRQRIEEKAPLMRRIGLLAYLDEQYAEIDTPEKLSNVIEAPFKTVAAWAAKYGIPKEDIFLGEFGMIRQEDGNPYRMPSQWRAAYLHDITTLSERYGYAWAVWSWGGAFGITNDDKNRILDPLILKGLGLK